VYEVVDNNSDHYRSMVMSAMRMNQDNASECSIIDKKPNVDATRFLNLLKDSNKPLWDEYTNHNKYLAFTQVFITKSDYKLNEVGCDKNHWISEKYLLEGK